MLRSIALALLLGICSCGRTAPPRGDALANGVYEVIAVEDTREALPTPTDDQRVLVFDRQFIKGGSEIPPQFVLLRVDGYAPLDLAKPPAEGEQNGAPVLLLNLQEDAGRSLEQLTSRVERAAVVIGGDIVTVHRIRVPIEGGGLQVSC